MEPPEDERRRPARKEHNGSGKRGAKPESHRAKTDGHASKPKKSRKSPAQHRGHDAAPGEARPPKRDPNAPAWNPIRARVEEDHDGDLERFARDETVRPKKKGSGRKQPKPGNHRKGQPRFAAGAAAAGKGKGKSNTTPRRSNGAPANNPRSNRGSSGKAKRPSEAAA